MNTLFISPNSPFESIGGVERYISNLINFCKKQSDIKAFIVLPTYGESGVEEQENVTIYLDSSMGLQKTVSGKEISEKAKEFSKNIEKIVVSRKIDIICAENFHVGLPPAYSLLLNMIASSHKIPLVLRIHSFATTELQVELVNQLLWNKISCVSKSVAGDCFQKGADINLLSTDYLGVDTAKFNSREDSSFNLKESLGLPTENKIILTASRILRGKRSILAEKGLINLIQAFSKLSPRFPNLNLLIAIGKPTENLSNEFELAKKMLDGYIKLNNVESKTIVKMFEMDEMADVYRGSDVFALPSENETFGQVFIEAMSCGLPVIGTKTGGIPEIISDSYNGYLIPPNDSSLLAQMLEKLLNDRSIRDKFIKSGIKTVKAKFTSESQLTLFISALKETAALKLQTD
jgi:glycosyltransferase involved in cell wall biosynthesis